MGNSYTRRSILALCLFATIHSAQAQHTLPSMIIGNFTDDYGVRYAITDTLWQQLPRAKYHIIEASAKDQYIIARNGAGNSTEPGLFTRIDYMQFSGMAPYEWGFCYTVYKAASEKEAREAAPADRINPRKGCGGFPFSRMKKEQ